MPRNMVKADDSVFDRASVLAYYSDSQCSNQKQNMRRILNKAIREELTEKERFCLTEYYINHRKMKDIAASLSLNPSTVTRNIKRATKKLRHIAGYY